MKNFFKGLTVITLALLIFPAVPWMIGAVSSQETVPAAAEITVQKGGAEDDEDDEKNAENKPLTEVRVYDEATRREIVLTAEEYVASALAAQLSPDCDPELLKAQAVLMYTYILRRMADEAESPTPELYGCLVSTDRSKYPTMLLGDEETLDLSAYRKIAKEVEGIYCAYAGEPITVAYCRSAGSSTESAKTVLGVDVPYLKEAATYEPDEFYTTVAYTSEEVFARLTTSPDGYILLGDPDGWIKIKDAAANGYVKEVYLDSRFIVSGSEVSRLLNLPSARFTFRYSKATDRFTFTVSGSGSLCGMSQRGAAVMASQGKSYREILEHYFDGVEIVGAGGE